MYTIRISQADNKEHLNLNAQERAVHQHGSVINAEATTEGATMNLCISIAADSQFDTDEVDARVSTSAAVCPKIEQIVRKSPQYIQWLHE